ncbi:hypothetical protein QTP86_034725 [Hemibagrus guttatus]|nr:hypothetical protein QTP86_034725 [Hemibagrus guttatus]
MNELLLLSRTNNDFSNSAALCFTESWLNNAIPDNALNLPGFLLLRADRVTESAGKSRSGGTCFYINERPKRMPSGMGPESCTIRPETHGIRRLKKEKQFSSNDPALVWKGLKDITNYKTPSPSTEANQQLAEDLNEFYCRFETAGLTPHAPSEHLSTQPLTPPATPLYPPPALRISEDDVHQIFLKQKKRKAPGPDGATPACLKTCADQLAFIFSQIFNRSLELCEVPVCFKRSTIIPIPKKPKITGLNDYRPVALTSVVMKLFERLVLAYLKNITGPLLDPLQFAYRANRSVDDAVNMGLHFILQHLDKSGTYVRLLFVELSSAFNTIIPTLLQTKLTQLSVPSSICQWITSFLTDRHQLVKLGKFMSNSRTTSTGAPQGCILSPLLFSVYTNDCTSTDPSVKLLKFADDTTVIGLIQDGDESAYRQKIEQLAAWCSCNNLELNTLKTEEMIADFRRNTPALPPLTIMNSTVPTVESFRFLGTTISQDMKWDTHIDTTIKKAQQRLYFLWQLRKFNLPQELLIHFYSAVIESVLCTSITVWFGSATKSDIRRLQRTVWTAEWIIGAPLPTLQELYTSRVRKRALKITLDPSHPGHILFDLLPSGRRYRAANNRTARHSDSDSDFVKKFHYFLSYNLAKYLVNIGNCRSLQNHPEECPLRGESEFRQDQEGGNACLHYITKGFTRFRRVFMGIFDHSTRSTFVRSGTDVGQEGLARSLSSN